jgi:hypothetical protein
MVAGGLVNTAGGNLFVPLRGFSLDTALGRTPVRSRRIVLVVLASFCLAVAMILACLGWSESSDSSVRIAVALALNALVFALALRSTRAEHAPESSS